MNVVVNGLMTSYQKKGKGKSLIFLHGWGDTSASFQLLSDRLSDNFQILTLDLPGFGNSQTPPQAWDLNDYALFLEDWIKKLKLEPYAILGHSYGGAVAITAVAHKKIADKLILIASAGMRNNGSLKKKFLRAGAGIAKIPLVVLSKDRQKKIKTSVYESLGSDLMLLPHMEATFRKVISQDVSADATKIKIPTLLIYGSHDKSTPPNDGRSLQAVITGSRLEVIDAGHFLHQEKPDLVTSLIREFLTQKEKNV